MLDKVVLIMRFHLLSGEDVSVASGDFDGEAEALQAIARAVEERRGLVLAQARYGGEGDVNGVVFNLANVVSVRVLKTAEAEAGEYL
jgi:hypothetical protein